MDNRDIIDVFDECIDRLAAGEDIDAILSDYPAEADELRGMLETGLLVYQVQNETPGVDEARSRGRGKLEEAMSELELENEKPKRGRRPVQWLVFAAAAAFTLVLGIGIGIGAGMSSQNTPQQPVYDVGMMLTATQIIEEVTGTAWAQNPANPEHGYVLTATQLVAEMTKGTATPVPFDPSVDSFQLTATSIIREITQTAEAEQAGANATTVPEEDAFILTATQFVKEVTQTAEFEGTVTAIAMGIGSTATPAPTETVTATVTATALPTQTAMPTLGPVSTSVMTYAENTSTPIPADAPVLAAVPTSDAFGGYVVLGTPTPVSMADASGREVGETDKDLGGGDAGVLEEPAVVDEITTRPESTTSSDGTGTTTVLAPTTVPDYSQLQLQPLKAGEIDDNADWDTYTLYRRNFLQMYSGLVLDVDISGRQIIKVINGSGLPVLGAKVEVFYGTQPVSQSMTYATGMTLFFPNAKPEFQRMDTFRVVVSKDGRTTEATLNIERIDDILTITLN